jgi:hypothetical protein
MTKRYDDNNFGLPEIPEFPEFNANSLFKVAHNFDEGDKVMVILPFTPDTGMVVSIVRALGPGILTIRGEPLLVNNLYQVYVPGVGDTESDGRPICYPSEFLVYAKPKSEKFEQQEKVDTESFIKTMESLGCGENIKNIIYGKESNG